MDDHDDEEEWGQEDEDVLEWDGPPDASIEPYLDRDGKLHAGREHHLTKIDDDDEGENMRLVNVEQSSCEV